MFYVYSQYLVATVGIPSVCTKQRILHESWNDV